MKERIMKDFNVRELTIAAGLSAFSAVVQLIHIGYQSPQFGMWIDLVAVSWLMALFLFGARMSFIVSLIGSVMITLLAPDTWLGASMKLVATMPSLIFLALWLNFRKKKPDYYNDPKRLIIPVVIAMVVRCLLVIPLNYYYAIPIWTGMNAARAMVVIPWYVIAVFNIIQGIFELTLAWLLVFQFRLKRYASWK